MKKHDENPFLNRPRRRPLYDWEIRREARRRVRIRWAVAILLGVLTLIAFEAYFTAVN